MLKLLFLGDVMGRSGREAVMKHLPMLIKEHKPDCVIVNGENAVHGFGITETVSKDLFQAGVNVITTGNHVWDRAEVLSYIQREKRLLRPQNYPSHLPGSGVCEFETIKGKKVVVINVMGRLFMEPMDNPFEALDTILSRYNLGKNAHAIFVDVHAETTSEKQAIGHYLDGRVSAVVGTHTHVPTADERILPKGTGYQTDAGMCGDYHNSIIGMQVKESLNKFLKRIPSERMKPAEGEGSVCGLVVNINEQGLTSEISRVTAGKPI